MGGRGSSLGGGGTTIAAGATGAYTFSGQYDVLTDQDAQQMRNDFDDMYDANTTAGIKMYTSNTNYDGQGHSLSQTLNYRLENGISLDNDASLSYTDAVMHSAAHPFNKDIQLQRGAHEDFLQGIGIKNYQNMSEKQLQNALVGGVGQFKAYVSTSYDVNKNPFLSAQSGSGVAGGRELVMNINAKGSTKGVFGAKKQTEIILDRGTNYRITGVHFAKDRNGNNKYASPRGQGVKKIVVLDIETW